MFICHSNKNPLVIIVNKLNDLPAWFYLQNPNVKTITIDQPSKEERESLVKGVNFSSFFHKEVYAADYSTFESAPEELEKIQDKFVALTDGMSFTELNGLRKLCKQERLHIREMCDLEIPACTPFRRGSICGNSQKMIQWCNIL